MEFITDVICLSVSSILDKRPDLGESETVPKDSTGQGGTQKEFFLLCLMVQFPLVYNSTCVSYVHPCLKE